MISNPWRKQIGVVFLTVLTLLAGCRSGSDQWQRSAAAQDLDAAITAASKLNKPLIILVIESGESPSDDQARNDFETLVLHRKNDSFMPFLLDISISRNRAAATRFHLTGTPTVLGLSPRGLIVTRDQTPITKDLILKQINTVAARWPALDAKLASLEEAVANNGNNVRAQFDLANFLLAQQNAREAIPSLASIAHSDSAHADQRVRAWVELARAHLWIAEPEKGRHEAEALITVLGPQTAEAVAGGNLVLGMQDANAKRISLARREFAAAISAAAQSEYGLQAAAALASHPEGNH